MAPEKNKTVKSQYTQVLSSVDMTACEVCGTETILPFICAYCGKPHCAEHRLPEAHACSGTSYTRIPTITIHNMPAQHRASLALPSFKLSELQQILVAWLVLGFCFSANTLSNLTAFPTMFAISLVTLGLGFIGHELAHRYLARRFGCWAEFRLWGLGLLMAVGFALISGGRMIFAAPGAVYITPRSYGLGYGITQKQNGLISISGPLANILVALIFWLFSGSGGFIGLVGSTGFRLNAWLAAFNLIPFGALDGRKVFSWNKVVWAIVTIPAWLMVFLL